MSQPKVSFHLNVLKEAGFLKDSKQGKWTHYRLDDVRYVQTDPAAFSLGEDTERSHSQPVIEQA